jgi:aldehyde dehydrogenase (NAD+)
VDNIERVLRGTTAGSTCVNEIALHFLHPELPFGGAGASGIGRGHGHHGFLDFSNERPVIQRTRPMPLMRLFHPPYSLAGRKLVSLLLKLL